MQTAPRAGRNFRGFRFPAVFTVSRMKSGSVPQQPPRISAPASARETISPPNSSGPTLYAPVTGSGRPAFGLAITGSDVFIRISRTMPAISAGPRAQLTPTASAPRPSIVRAMEAGVQPVNVRPVASKLIVTNTGSPVFSFTASSAAFASYRSLIVSITARSAPASAPARAICANMS